MRQVVNCDHQKGGILKKTAKIGLVSLLMAMSTVNPPVEATTANQANTESTPTIEDRLGKITATVRERENQLEDTAKQAVEGIIIAGAWGNGNARGWVNGGGGGWANSGGWRNGNNWGNGNSWRDGWRDGGSFYNYR